MSSFTQVLNDKNQFLIVVKVIKSLELEEHRQGRAERLIADALPRRALIDTGASRTCVSQECADELSLIPIGQVLISTASGLCQVPRYETDLAIPVAITQVRSIGEDGGEEAFERTVTGEHHWVHIRRSVNSIPATGVERSFDVVLGMDILSQMHLTIYGRQIVISF